MKYRLAAPLLLLVLAMGCMGSTGSSVRGPLSPEQVVAGLNVPTTSYALENGLKVVLHPDRSDPIVAVAVMFHVGSAREEPGKTGFAHLFEHILFQESENVPQDTFFRKIQTAGGTLNGGTWQDGTIYYEVVPKNALEMVLWMESDRMGFLLGALDDQAFYNQQLVVMNEKRQRVDNQPYGNRSYIINKKLYPDTHPYNWQVIGSMTDIAGASLDDVRHFFKRWYGPNNATIVIAGDYDEAEVRTWIQRYFGEIPSGPSVATPLPVAAQLSETLKSSFEDNFATVPELSVVWPTVPAFHEDEAALDLLAEVLAEGKTAALYKRLVEEKKLTSRVSAMHSCGEIAGTFQVRVRAVAGGSLDALYLEMADVLNTLEESFVDETRLQRIKAQFENGFYNRVASVFGKSMTLAMYSAFLGDPDYVRKDLARYLRVTPAAVRDVFNRYLKGQHQVVMSMVPRGQGGLAVTGSRVFTLPADDGVKPLAPSKEVPKPPRTPSKIERSVEPAKGPVPVLSIPAPEKHVLANGMELSFVNQPELPIVHFSIDILGGHGVDPLDKPGLANLTAKLLKEGTRRKTPAQLEEALELLGTFVDTAADSEMVTVQGYCLARNFKATVSLVREMLVEPRFDAGEFDRLKRKVLTDLDQQKGVPAWIAQVALLRRLFGEGRVWSYPSIGSKDGVQKITLEDVKAWHQHWLHPARARITVVGAVSMAQVKEALATLESNWVGESGSPKTPKRPPVSPVAEPTLYIVDIPGALQSEIRVARLAMPKSHADYYPAYLANYTLGGNFNSRVNLILREEKGYTYGARTGFHSGLDRGLLVGSSAVQSDATGESLKVFKDEIARTAKGPDAGEVEFTRQALQNSMMREFETLGNLLEAARNIGVYGLPADYVERRQKTLQEMTAGGLVSLVGKYFAADKMIYLVVGDRESVQPQLEKAGFGVPVLLDREGNPLGD